MNFRLFGLFRGMPDSEVDKLVASANRREVETGTRIVKEGESATRLYLLVSGKAEVLKREDSRDVEHAIGEVLPGDVIGEVTLFDRLPRSASVVALEPCVVWAWSFEDVHNMPRVVANLVTSMSDRLRTQTESSLKAAMQRSIIGEMVVKVIILLCLYAVLLAALPRVSEKLPGSTSYLSVPIIAVFGFGSWRFIRNTGYPLSLFGLGFKNFFGSLFESIILTVPFLALLTGVKWLLLQSSPKWRILPLFEHGKDWAQKLTEPTVMKLLAVYAVSAIVQELIVRGALQSSLEMFISGKSKKFQAILVSALMFSVNHLHMSFLFAALAFLPGIFWGWMFSRRRNLVGPTLSHFATGAFVFFVLGIGLT